MIRFSRLAIPFLAAALLAGCGHVAKVKVPLIGNLESAPPPSLDSAVQRLASATPCCHAWADLPFNDPLPDAPQAYTLDRFSPVAELGGERTHFITFVLPKFRKPYRVAFQAEPSARGLKHSFLLAPTVTVLNAAYEPLASTDLPLCVYINWRPSMSGAFGAVTIDQPAAQYLVVTTSKKQLAATTYWAQSPTTFSDVNVPNAPGLSGLKQEAPVTSGHFDVKHGPEGTLYIGKMTPAYASAVDNGLCGKPEKGSGLLPELRRSLQNR